VGRVVVEAVDFLENARGHDHVHPEEVADCVVRRVVCDGEAICADRVQAQSCCDRGRDEGWR
jgi:hypothetical protein